MDGRFRRNSGSPLCDPPYLCGRNGSPQGAQGIPEEARRGASRRGTFLTLMFIDVLLQGADPALLLTQH